MNNLCNRNCSCCSSSSAQLIAENEDVFAEILLHLPVKSLLRFKCVSRKWRSVISSPYFALRHTRRNSSRGTSSLLILRSRALLILSLGNNDHNSSPAGFRIPSFNFLNLTPDFTLRILGTCNGLMLCYLGSAFNGCNFSYCVCNLTTKRFITLPRPEMIANKHILGVNLAFDPLESPNFKVVCVGQSCILNDHHCQIEIYSSETGLWRRWNGSFCNQYNILQTFDQGVFCNGAVHWLCTVGDSLYFDLKDESLKTLPMPPIHGDIYTPKRMRHLGQSGGHLQLIDSEAKMYHNPPMDIYEMNGDYSGWFLKYSIDLNDIGCLFPDMVGHVEVHTQFFEDGYSVHLSKYFLYSILSVVGSEDGQSLEVILSIPNKIISYNPKENSARVLLCLGDNMNTLDYRWRDVYQLKDTLSWL